MLHVTCYIVILLYSCGKWRIILAFTEKVVSLHPELKTSAMTDYLLLNN